MKKSEREISSYTDSDLQKPLSVRDYKFLQQQLDVWEKQGRILPEKKQELLGSISYERPEKQLAKYFFIIAVSSALLAFISIFINDKFLETVKKYFALSNIFIALIAGIIAVVWLLAVKKKKERLSAFSYEIYLIPGARAALTSLVYFSKDLLYSTHYSVSLLSAVVLLFVLSILFRSSAFWFAALVALCGWYGAFTSWQNVSGLYFGMNYPMRFVVLGIIILAFSFIQQNIRLIKMQKQISYFLGIVVLLTALWGVSVFGNYANFDAWQKVRQTQVLGYSFLFAAVSGIVFFVGIKNKDEATRDLGLLFLLLNLYTRYFEFFWDSLNKGIFFLVLALSFFALGKWLEKRKAAKKEQQS